MIQNHHWNPSFFEPNKRPGTSGHPAARHGYHLSHNYFSPLGVGLGTSVIQSVGMKQNKTAGGEVQQNWNVLEIVTYMIYIYIL